MYTLKFFPFDMLLLPCGESIADYPPGLYYEVTMSHTSKRALIFVGPQGCGKATQSQILEKEQDYAHIDIGGYMRAFVRDNPTDALAMRIKEIMDQGHLIDDHTLIQLFERAVQEKTVGKSKIILDGVMRKILQTEMALEVLKREGFDDAVAIHLDIPKEETLARLKKRAELEGRADDADEEKVLRRLNLYETETKPVIPYLESKGVKVHHVDGVGSIAEVAERIKKVLG